MELNHYEQGDSMTDSQHFQNGRAAGLVLAAAESIRAGNVSFAEDLLSSAGITPDEDLSFCADYDLEALRNEFSEFDHCYGDDAEWERDDERTMLTMLLISSKQIELITADRIASWTDEECQAVENYCRAVHINASDNDDYPVPPKPSVLEVA